MSSKSCYSTYSRRPKSAAGKPSASSSKKSSALSVAECELKSCPFSAILAADTTGAMVLLNGLVPGVALNQRIGRSIHTKRLDFTYISGVTVGTGSDQCHRLLIVQDSQANGAAPAILDVLDTVSTLAQPNISNVRRFRIVYDRTWALSATAEANSQRTAHLSLPLKGITYFNAGTAGTVADISTNSLYAIVVGQNVAGVTAGFVSIIGRTRFTDQ